MTVASTPDRATLQAELRALRAENEALVMSAETLLLLRTVSNELSSSTTQRALLDAVLEKTSILCNLAWSACFASGTDELTCLASYVLSAPESEFADRLTPSPHILDLPAKRVIVFNADQGRTTDIGVHLDATQELYVYPFGSLAFPRGVFMFAASQASSDGARANLASILSDVCSMAVLGLERLHDVAELEQRVAQRTAALEASEQRARAVFEQSAAGVAEVDRKGRILRANMRLAQMLGYDDPHGLEGCHLSAYFDGAPDSNAVADALWGGKKPHVTTEKRYQRSDGSFFWGRSVMSLLKIPADGSERALLVLMDVTREKSAEEALRQAQRLESIGALAGGIAHDFNNLLLPILALSEMLVDKLPRGADRDDIQSIHTAAERAKALTAKILAFSRHQMLEMTVIRPSEVVSELDLMLRRTIRSNIELRFDVTGSNTTVLGDRVQLEQVVVNLVLNAKDAITDDGVISVVVDDVRRDGNVNDVLAGEYVRIRVTDTGMGMPPETMSRVFEPFFTTKPLGKGTGLGLATVFGTVSQHNGHMSVSSEMSVGTCFEVLLPAHQDAVTEDALPPASVPSPGNRCIAVVDDDDVVREVVRRILQRAGFEVAAFADGASCLEAVTSGDVSTVLLVSDMMMPEMTGRELYGRMRELVPELRCILMSGYSAEDIDLANDEQNVTFVPKPLNRRAFLRCVSESLGEHAATDQSTR